MVRVFQPCSTFVLTQTPIPSLALTDRLKLEGIEPELDQNHRLVPLIAYGVKAMSMGNLVPQESPIAWRGLMVQKALNQLLFEVSWPKLDLLILDLPPGTGDVQLTITQSISLDGKENRMTNTRICGRYNS